MRIHAALLSLVIAGCGGGSQICNPNTTVPSDPSATGCTVCGSNSCAHIDSDPQSCGSCGVLCPAGDICSDGVCCAPGQVALLGQCVNPQQQVICDGNDDTGKLNKALMMLANTGGIVAIAKGTCKLQINATTDAANNLVQGVALNIPGPNVSIIGAGIDQTTLQLSGSGDYRAIVSNWQWAHGAASVPSPDVTQLSGLTIDGNAGGNPIAAGCSTGGCNGTCPCPTCQLFCAEGARWVIDLNYGDITVDHCRFTNIDDLNVLVINGNNVTATNSVFDSIGGGAFYHDHSSITLTNTEVSGATTGNIVITGNILTGVGPSATTAIETHGSNQSIHDNHITSYMNGFNVSGEVVARDSTKPASSNIDVFKNKVSRALIGVTLWSRALPANGGAVSASNPPSSTYGYDKAMIHDNQIDLDLIGGAQAVWPDIAQLYMGGIRLSEDDFSAFGDLTIAGNTIVFHSYACGAALLPSMAFSDGAGVRLTRCAPQHQGPCYPTQCVPLAGESCIDHDITISGNQIVDDGVSPTSPGAPGPGIYVWLDDDSLDNLHIDQNVIRNAGWFVKNNPQSGWPPAAIWLYSFPPGGNQTDVGAFTGTVEVNCNDIIDQLSALSFGIEATDVVIPGAATAQGNMYTGANLIDDPLQKFSVSTLPCGLVP